jgi:hypothetical protein
VRSPLSGQSRTVPEIEKFRPRTAIKVITSEDFTSEDFPTFVRTWEFVRFFAWIYFDQRKGKTNIRTRDARKAGHMALADLLDREFGQRDGKKLPDNVQQQILSLFMATGGFGAFLERSREATGFLKMARKKDKQLKYVHQIVSYLCRLKIYNMDISHFNLKHAKCFVQQIDPTFKVRTIEKYWETNKQAAPYIFAFFNELSISVAKAESIRDVVNSFQQLVADQKRMKELFGAAAYAADVLVDTKVRNVRQKDFSQVGRIPPHLPPFAPDELAILSMIDPHQLSAKDKLDFRPETIRPKLGQRKTCK